MRKVRKVCYNGPIVFGEPHASLPRTPADSTARSRIRPVEHLLVLALLLLCELIIFRHELFQGAAIYFQVFRDLNPFMSSFWYQYHSQALAQGFFPLWNPWRGMGFPQIANYQSGFFSPLLAPLFLLPLPIVAVPYLILRLMLAGWGTYVYARHLKLRHWPAVLAGLAFALSGWMMQYVNNQHLVIDLLLPFLLLSLDRLTLFRRFRDLLLLWLVVLLILLGGQPTAALFTLGLGLAYALFQVPGSRFQVPGSKTRNQKPETRNYVYLFQIAVPLLLALLGSLIQTLPFLEFIPQAWTYHPARFGLQHLPLATAIILLAPGFFGALYQVKLPVMATLPYLGAIPLAYALAGLLHCRKLKAPAAFFAATAVAAFGFLHGLPGFSLFMALPGLNRLFFFKYCQPLLTFAVAILAGIAADRLSKRELRRVAGLTLILLLLGLILEWNWIPEVRRVRILSCELSAGGLVLAWLFSGRPRALALLAGLGLIADAQFNSPMKLYFRQMQDLPFFAQFRSGPPDYPRLTASEDVPPIEAAAWQVDDIRIGDAIFVNRMIRYLNLLNGHTPEQGLAYLYLYNYTRVVPDPERFQGPLGKLARLRWYLNREPLPANTTLAQILKQAQAVAPGPGYFGLTDFDLQGDFRRALFQHPPSRIEVPAAAAAGHTGLKFALALDPKQWSNPGDGVWFGVFSKQARTPAPLRLLFGRNLNPSQRESDRRWVDQELKFRESGSVLLVTLPGPSTAYDWSGWGDLRWLEEPVLGGRIEDGVRVHENPGAFPLAWLVGNWQGARDAEASAAELLAGHDWASWAVVEGVASSSEGKARALGQVQVLEKGDGYLQLSVEAKRDCLLLLTENYFPGWQARRNGLSVRIYPADLAFRGVFVPAGASRIEMVYRPWAFRIGLWSSLGTVLGAVAGVLFLGKASPALRPVRSSPG